MTYEMMINPQFNSLEIKFDGKPSEEIRQALKDLKFRWHSVKKVWYGYTDEATAKAAIDGKAVAKKAENVLVIPESEEVINGGLYDGWRGGNNRKWHSDQELKKFLLDDFKKAGISATVRFGRGGYTTSMTVTIKITEDEIKDFEDYRNEYNTPFTGWIYYTNEDGKYDSIYADSFWSLPDDEREAMRENVIKTAYKMSYENLTSSNTHHGEEMILTNAANQKFATVQAIVSSYNRDCSNSMIDYFDRDIYDWYTFKIA